MQFRYRKQSQATLYQKWRNSFLSPFDTGDLTQDGFGQGNNRVSDIIGHSKLKKQLFIHSELLVPHSPSTKRILQIKKQFLMKYSFCGLLIATICTLGLN